MAGEVPAELREPGITGRIGRRQTTYWDLTVDGVRIWRVRFRGKAEFHFAGPIFSRVEVVERHPLLTEYNEEWEAVYFFSCPREPGALIAELKELAERLFGPWRSATRYLHPTPEDLLRWPSGLLPCAPRSFSVPARKILRRAGVRFSCVPWPRSLVPKKVLFVGDSFVVATSFEFERIDSARAPEHEEVAPVGRTSKGRQKAMLETVWSYPIHHDVAAFVMDGDDCFVAARKTRLVALCARTGAVRWSVRIPTQWGLIAFNAQTVFHLNQLTSLSAFDRRTGQLIWSRELPNMHLYGWLHASEERVVVGGWRGYRDIVALDAKDGSTCWTRSARGAGLHSTRIHAESSSLVIGEPLKKRITFVRLADGHDIGEYPADAWAEAHEERPTGTTRAGCPIVIRSGEHELLLIEGTTPHVRRVQVPASIWSHDLACTGSVVPFVTSTQELLVFDFVENQTLSLGPIRDVRCGWLPFCQLSDGTYLLGTSYGVLRRLSPPGKQIAARRLGKRIATSIALAGGVAVCGTDSGEIVGVDVTIDG